MGLLLATVAAVALLSQPAVTTAGGDDDGGNRVLMTTLPAPSMHEMARSVRVYLPPSYPRPESAKRRYPVVYLLHGWPGGDGNWVGHGRAAQTLDSLSAHGAIPEMIAVMPNGNGIGLLGRQGWLNSYDGRAKMEDFVWKDLVQWTDQHYRTIPDSAHRALIGLSEGATAALNIAFKHPGVFMACGGLSGEYVVGKDVGMKAVWGDEATATRIREENSPTLYAAKIVATLRRQVIYFDCGASDSELEDNQRLERTLTQLGVPHVYQEFPGTHGWGFWKIHLRDALLACTPQMK
jgi:enterochelin esterase-like enzyme